jgi:transglutaminase-like putative cysteine protease
MRFRIAYVTEYEYSEAVRDNLNVLRVRPATTPHQSVDDFSLRVDPEARLHSYRDYFGAEVIEFGVTEPHERLRMEARMHVTTREQPVDPDEGWTATEASAYRSAAGEYLLHTSPPPDDARIAQLVEAVRADTPLQTAQVMSEVIADRFDYDSESTFVGSTVADLLEAGGGVCQDFVHLGLVLLREHGVGARYVSGYLFAAPKDGGDDSVEVQTHAWLEALLPDGEGELRWIGFDPTNRSRAGERYVKIGHGRHYQDVPPIRGVYRGPATSELSAGVQMTRLNGDAPV